MGRSIGEENKKYLIRTGWLGKFIKIFKRNKNTNNKGILILLASKNNEEEV